MEGAERLPGIALQIERRVALEPFIEQAGVAHARKVPEPRFVAPIVHRNEKSAVAVEYVVDHLFEYSVSLVAQQ